MPGLRRLHAFQNADIQGRKVCGIQSLEMKTGADPRLATHGVGMDRWLILGKKNQIPGIISVFVTKKIFLEGVENWKP